METKHLGTEHSFILRLLGHGEMSASTLTSANFGTLSQTRRMLEYLIGLDLVERKFCGDAIKYKRK
ncbi:MAG: hypothetical protein V3R86_05095 [Candidatus Hydrothermarchaeaceae archaeon]